MRRVQCESSADSRLNNRQRVGSGLEKHLYDQNCVHGLTAAQVASQVDGVFEA